jgi:hypothetical protein
VCGLHMRWLSEANRLLCGVLREGERRRVCVPRAVLGGALAQAVVGVRMHTPVLLQQAGWRG